VNRVYTCTLCGLELPHDPVVSPSLGPDRPFCCAGCALVYDVAAQAGRLDEVLAPSAAHGPALGGLLAPGEAAYFELHGMWCAGCAVVAQRILERQPGVAAAEVSFASERGRLRYDLERTDADAALASLEGLGYRATLVSDAADDRDGRREDHILWQFLVALGFGMSLMAVYLSQLYRYYALGRFDLPTVGGLHGLAWALATPVLLLGGASFPRGAWRALRAGTATMDTLVTLAIYAAYGYIAYMAPTGTGQTYFDAVTMIVVFVTLGRSLEALGAGRARKDIRRLLRLQPPRARRCAGEGWEEVPARNLASGDTILVRPGERVPADAVILSGEGALEEALLTGESLPVNKGPGDTVYAGTLLTDAALTCRVTQPAARTRLAQITRLVEETLASRPPIQRLADRASAWLTVGVLAAAGLTALGWWASGHGLATMLLAAIAVLVVACPCALGLATPLALTVALGRAAQAGILVRNPAALEAAARIQRIVLDKTGTLTRGRMAVVAAAAAPDLPIDREALLRLAAAVEQYSEHPIARAIVAACPGAPPAASAFQTVRGMGRARSWRPHPDSPPRGER